MPLFQGRIFLEEVGFDDSMMPGLQEIRSELQSWQWIYGKTPDFTLRHRDDNLSNESLTVKVVKGLITGMKVHSQRGFIDLTETFHLLPFCPLMLRHHYDKMANTNEIPLLESLIAKMQSQSQ